jgi:hypothetical protein
MLEQVTMNLSELPEEDLPLVLAFVDYLKQQHQTGIPPQRLSVAAIRAEAQRRAEYLHDIPRSDVIARFQQLAEEIRHQAIASGTATEGDWPGD